MDQRRLDRLARSLATATNRRPLLRGFVAAAVGSFLGSDRSRTFAQSACQTAQTCVQTAGPCIAMPTIAGDSCICIQTAIDPAGDWTCRNSACTADSDCAAGEVCAWPNCPGGVGHCETPCEQASAAASACPDGQTLCDGRCVDLMTNLLNCGACGTQCIYGGDGVGQTCLNGVCTCPGPYTLFCNEVCYDPGTDPTNCGGCGVSCNGGACVNGTCAEAGTSGEQGQLPTTGQLAYAIKVGQHRSVPNRHIQDWRRPLAGRASG